MKVPNSAVSAWFGKGQQADARLLREWREAPLSYSGEQEIDHQWNIDRYDTILGQDTSGALFERAARLVLNNQFYPRSVMVNVSDFGLEGRPVRVGDRVLQRFLIFQFRGRPLLEAMSMNEVTEVIDEPRRAGFTYTTTSAHPEIGEYSPLVEWRENGEVALVVNVVSRARPGTSVFLRRFTRRMQLRAHRLTIQNFLAQLHRRPFRSTLPTNPYLKFLPAALLLAALLFLLIYRRRGS